MNSYTGFELNDTSVEGMHKKWSLPLRISSVNMTKSAGNLMEDFIFCVVEHIPTVIWDIRTGY